MNNDAPIAAAAAAEPPATVIKTPGAFHAGYSPCVFHFRSERGKLVNGWLSGTSFDPVPLRLYFYDYVVRVDLGPHIRSVLATRELGGAAVYNVYLSDDEGHAHWVAGGVALPAVVQIGETADMTPLVGRTLSGFDRLTAWDGYERDRTVLGDRGPVREDNSCVPAVCSGRFGDFVDRVAVTLLGADAAGTALALGGDGVTLVKLEETT